MQSVQSLAPALDIRGLWKAYEGRPALAGVDLTVSSREVHGLVGPNGAGKTTSLKIVMGLLRADAGSVRVLGTDVAQDMHEYKAHVGYLPEAPSLPDFLTGEEFLGAIARLRGMTPEAAKQRARDLLSEYDLLGRSRDLIVSYSKGMKQKLAICTALVHKPGLLIIDEPFLGMDPAGQHRFKETLRSKGDDGPAVLLSTHMLDTAERLCDRVSILHRGKVVATGVLDELRNVAHAGGDASLEEVFLKLTEEASQPEPERASLPRRWPFRRFPGGL